jgi:antitoxin component YwqK of YwqJK toxin-antitoxin module
MSTSSRKPFIALGVALVLAAAIGWLYWNGGGQLTPATDPLAERTRDQLELRDEGLFEKDASEPFDGLLVEFYPGKKRKVAIEVHNGKPHGLSRGWHDNGQLEVEEHFVNGTAHGLRTRWFENGQKRSEARIENGQITGTFLQWHDNGQKAAEATLVEGKPEGLSRGWHRSGAPKSRIVMRSGEIVSQQFFEEGSH